MYRRKLYFVVGLIVLMAVGFLATSLSSYFVAHDSLSRQLSEQTLPLTSDNIYSEIQRDLLRPVLISSLMASDTFLRDWVMAGEIEELQIRAYLEQIQSRYDTITAFFVSDATHRYYHPSGVIKEVSPEDPEDDWYFRVRGLRDPYEINIDDDTADRSRLSIFINYRVLDASGALIGVTGVGLAVNSVVTLINNYQARYGRRIYFIDRLGNITLTGSNGETILESRVQERPGMTAAATQILSSPSMSLNYRRPDGESVFVNSRLVPEFDWYLVVEQVGSESNARIQSTLMLNISISLGIMAMVLFAAHHTLRAYQGQLERMATTDRLTGVANRYVFETLFDHITKAAMRRDRPISLIGADIDHFKKVNDTYGHLGGDQVLRVVADIVRAHVRESDVVCRWGGEEFMILLEDCNADEAARRASVIAEAVRHQTITFGRDKIKVTLSCGVAQHHKGEPLESLTGRVDVALYEAKHLGRDQVCMAD